MNNIGLVKKLPIFVLLILLLSLLSGCLDSSNNNGGEDFVFTSLYGEEKHLSDFFGKIIVLDLMGATCRPCQAQMFVLKEISENYTNADVEIISIDVWVMQGETADHVEWLIDAFKQQEDIELDWTFGLDDTSGTIFKKYVPSGGVPTIHILDKKGNIYYSHHQYADYSILSTKIDELLD